MGQLPNQYINLEPIPFGPKKRKKYDKLVEDAKLLERLGCFALVLVAHLAEK
jgi:ketopantoate hydroxymethyltransferase